MDFPSKPVIKSSVLITGLNGFTGRHLSSFLSLLGYEILSLDADICDRAAVFEEILLKKPDYVFHLAAISFSAEENIEKIYNVNVIGTVNLLDALCQLRVNVKRIILASSASVYGNQPVYVLNESLCPKPVNHYGCSKLSMEHLSHGYSNRLNIVITRPFNYTGIGHGLNFLLPKIVNAYQRCEKKIQLGNLDVAREFNDVRDICLIYASLLEIDIESAYTVVNISSGRGVKLLDIIDIMDEIAGFRMKVEVNPAFVRSNEILSLTGCTERLNSLVDVFFSYSIRDTLSWMYSERN